MAPALNDPLVREKGADEIAAHHPERGAGHPDGLLGERRCTKSQAGADRADHPLGRSPRGAIPAPDRPVPVTEESLALGSQLFSQNCSRCHGPEGQGTPRAPSLNVKSYLANTNDAAMQQIITLGVPGTAMPAWGDRLADARDPGHCGLYPLLGADRSRSGRSGARRGRSRGRPTAASPAGSTCPAAGSDVRGKDRAARRAGRGPFGSQSAAASPVVGANPTLQPASEAQAVAQPTAAAAPAATAAAASGQVGTPAAAGHAGQASAGAKGQAAGSGPPGRARQHRQMKVFHSTGWSKTGGQVV